MKQGFVQKIPFYFIVPMYLVQKVRKTAWFGSMQVMPQQARTKQMIATNMNKSPKVIKRALSSNITPATTLATPAVIKRRPTISSVFHPPPAGTYFTS